MVAVEFLFMPRVGGPYFASIEEGAENAGLVDAQSGVLSEPGVISNTLVQFSHDCSCLGNPAVDLRVDG